MLGVDATSLICQPSRVPDNLAWPGQLPSLQPTVAPEQVQSSNPQASLSVRTRARDCIVDAVDHIVLFLVRHLRIQWQDDDGVEGLFRVG